MLLYLGEAYYLMSCLFLVLVLLVHTPFRNSLCFFLFGLCVRLWCASITKMLSKLPWLCHESEYREKFNHLPLRIKLRKYWYFGFNRKASEFSFNMN
ncbi:unnamed protein product [Camellia sinensis]